VSKRTKRDPLAKKLARKQAKEESKKKKEIPLPEPESFGEMKWRSWND
jgi:hypothetical protein